jgi:hypothetical protein
MKRALLCVALLLLTVPVLAETPDGYERLVLSIAPSYSLCGYHSRYDTRLLVFNDGDVNDGDIKGPRPICTGGTCYPPEARKAITIEGPITMTPLPAFLYVPRDLVKSAHLTLMVESSDRERGSRAFAEIPILHESDFQSRLQLLGVRVEKSFRVTLRIYGLDTPDDALSVMRIFDMDTNELLTEEIYGFERFPSAPSMAMECDISDIGPLVMDRNLRIEVVTNSDDVKAYAFVSTTDNATQRFTIITPK